MHWYYTIDGSQRGPVSEDELRRLAADGPLKPDDLVWNETMDAWAPASSVFKFLRAGPPPLPRADAVSGLADGAAPPLWRGAAAGISCTDAVGPAWDRMRAMLFRPFDLGKWFVLGFSAWLASLGEGGIGSFNPGSGWRGSGQSSDAEVGRAVEHALLLLKEHWGLIALIAVPVVVLATAVALLLMWVRARGAFMFLDNVVNDRTEIAACWRQYKRQANSLFLWNLGFGVVCLIGFLLLLGCLTWGVILPCVTRRAFLPSVLPALLAVVFVWLVFAIVAGYILRFLKDFVVPIMYRFGLTATEGWRRFLPLLRAHFWRLLLYGLFYGLLGMAAGVCVLLAIVCTCCIAGCLMIIPYIGSVVLLPVTVYFRNYSLAYLAQFGPEFDLLRHGGNAGPGAGAGQDSLLPLG